MIDSAELDRGRRYASRFKGQPRASGRWAVTQVELGSCRDCGEQGLELVTLGRLEHARAQDAPTHPRPLPCACRRVEHGHEQEGSQDENGSGLRVAPRVRRIGHFVLTARCDSKGREKPGKRRTELANERVFISKHYGAGLVASNSLKRPARKALSEPFDHHS